MIHNRPDGLAISSKKLTIRQTPTHQRQEVAS